MGKPETAQRLLLTTENAERAEKNVCKSWPSKEIQSLSSPRSLRSLRLISVQNGEDSRQKLVLSGAEGTEDRIGKPGNQGNSVQEPEGRRQMAEDSKIRTRSTPRLPLSMPPGPLYNCRECSTNRPLFFQNKANLSAGQNWRKLSVEKGL